jgi:hypothetical protein
LSAVIKEPDTLPRVGGISIAELLERDGVFVDRAKAQAWLKTYNKQNRDLKPGRLARYTRDMTNDMWLPEGEPIRFDEDGRLADGQHRLEALIRASIQREQRGLSGEEWGLKFLVLTDLPRETRLVSGTGAPKSLLDAALIADGTKYASNVVPIGNRVYNWLHGQNPVPTSSNRITLTELEFAEFYAKHTGEINRSAYWGGHLKQRLKVSALAMGFGHYLITEAAAEHTERTDVDVPSLFFHSLSTGAELIERHPAKTLRETYATRRDNHTLTTEIALALLLRAWNAFAEERLYGSAVLPAASVTSANLALPKAPNRNWTGTIYNPTRH